MKNKSEKKKSIVVVGGGTGTSVVLTGLKKYDVDLTALVSVVDSGGSTGRLRDEFGFQPVGDLRQSLAALADDADQAWIRELLLYRFSQGDGLEGHNLGNLILTALQDMAKSTPRALEIAEAIFNLKGKIYPTTTKNVELVIEYEDGTFMIGEHNLNPGEIVGKKISEIRLSPKATFYEKAAESILAADLVIIGPGDLYASILPNFLPVGAKEVIKKTRALIVYISNIMTSSTQTRGYTVSEHVIEIEKYIVRKPDWIIANSGIISKDILHKYEEQQENIVTDDLDRNKYQVISQPLAKIITTPSQKSDILVRSLIRHDEDKLAKILFDLIN